MPKKGFKFSKESKRKMSLAKKGRKLSEVHKQRVSASLKKMYASKEGKELKERLSESHKLAWSKIPKGERPNNKQWWASLTKQEKLAILKPNIEKGCAAAKKWWAKFTPEERSAKMRDLARRTKEKRLKTTHKFWDSLTPEQRSKQMANATRKSVATWAAMSEEEYGEKRGKFLVEASKRLESSLERGVQECLVNLGLTFETHVLFGKYVADIHLPKEKTVIEVDGTRSHSSRKARAKDKRKDEYLASLGVTVVRILERNIRRKGFEECTKEAIRKVSPPTVLHELL
jgi:very-short-patch-repair endonuclease